MLRARLLFAICILLALPGAAAASAVRLGGGGVDASSGYPLESHMRVLFDPSGERGLAGAMAAAERGDFEPLPRGRGANFGIRSDTVWLRFTIAAGPEAGGRYVIEVPYAALDRVRLHVPGAPPGQRVQRAGDRVAFAERPIEYRYPAFPIEIAPGERVTAYLEVASTGAVQAPARLWPEGAFHAATRADGYVVGTYYGIFVAIGLYNLLIFFVLRDRNYLYYVLAVASFALFAFSLNGLTFQYLWPDSPAWTNTATAFFGALGAATILQFGRSFLEVGRYLPRVGLCLAALQIAAVALVVAVFALPYRAAAIALTVLVFATSVSVLASGIVCLARGGKQARYFVLAWALFLLGGAAFALHVGGLLPSSVLTRNGVQIGSALEMILLSLALADRKFLLQQENERIRREANECLEARVAQRTEELRAAVTELDEANRRLAEMSRRDPLTGLYNRLGMQEALEREWRRSSRDGRLLTLVLIDLDDFKAINDAHGHPFGDAVLRELAGVLLAPLRAGTDVVARYGGEEFAIVLPETDAATGHAIAERLRREIGGTRLGYDGQRTSVTISAGLSTRAEGDRGPGDLIERADRALYRAKMGGRDRTVADDARESVGAGAR